MTAWQEMVQQLCVYMMDDTKVPLYTCGYDHQLQRIQQVEEHSKLQQYKRICVQKYIILKVPKRTAPGYRILTSTTFHMQAKVCIQSTFLSVTNTDLATFAIME